MATMEGHLRQKLREMERMLVERDKTLTRVIERMAERERKFVRVLGDMRSGLQVSSERFSAVDDVAALARGCELGAAPVVPELKLVDVGGRLEYATDETHPHPGGQAVTP